MVAESYRRMSQPSPDSEQDLMQRCQHAFEHAVEEYPLALTVSAFALGLGLGAAIGASLARPLGMHREIEAERLGRRVLESIAEYLPSSVQRYVH